MDCHPHLRSLDTLLRSLEDDGAAKDRHITRLESALALANQQILELRLALGVKELMRDIAKDARKREVG